MIPVIFIYSLFLVFRPGSLVRPMGFRPKNLLTLIVPVTFIVALEINRLITTGYSVLALTFEDFFGLANTNPIRLLFSIVLRLGLAVVVLGIFSGLYWIIRQDRAGLFISIAAVVPIVILLGVAPFAFTVDRYVFIVLPFWLILAASFVFIIAKCTRNYKFLLATSVGAVLLTSSFSELFLYFNFQNGNRPNWKEAVAIVQEQKQERDVIIATRPEVSSFYLGEKVGQINNFDPEEVVANGNRVWFIIDESTSYVEPKLLAWIQDMAQLVDIQPVYLPGKSMAIRTYVYKPSE